MKDDALAVAERLLENVTWSNITSEVATALTGSELPDEPGKRFYLLRAVYLNAATGGFSVAICEDCVYVHHGCLGAFPVPMKRHALVVQLERPPKDVFVTCGMAQ